MMRVFSSRASEQATRKACRELSEKSAATSMVRKGITTCSLISFGDKKPHRRAITHRGAAIAEGKEIAPREQSRSSRLAGLLLESQESGDADGRGSAIRPCSWRISRARASATGASAPVSISRTVPRVSGPGSSQRRAASR